MSDGLMHEKYGQIYFVGTGNHKSPYVKAWSEKEGKMVSAMVNTEREQKRLEKEREKELKYRAKVAGAKYVKPKK